MPDIDLFVARNPENPGDASWFTSEPDAFAHWCDHGDIYLYTAFNDVEGWALPMNDEFEDRAATNAIEAAQIRRHERSFSRPF